MNILEELVSQVVIPVLALILTGVCTWLGVQFKEKHKAEQEDKTKKLVTEMCVKAVQQMYGTLTNEERLKKCTEAVNEILEEKGINITEFEARILIESSLGTLKHIFEGQVEEKI